MLKNSSHKIIKLLTLLGLLFLLLPLKVEAQSFGQLTIESGAETSGTVFKLWQVDTQYSEELEKQLRTLTLEELDQKYPQNYQSEPVNQTGKTVIDEIAEGIYYGVAIDVQKNHKIDTIVPFFVEITASKQAVVKPKVEVPAGQLKIIKVSTADNAKRLSGVVFELYEGSSKEPLRFHKGKVTLEQFGSTELTTDVNGEILLSGLRPGTYKLVETKPLSGYQVLNTPLEVVVTANQMVEVIVENEPSGDGAYKFRKVDSKNLEQGLSGAVFKVVVFDGKQFKDVIRDGKTYEVTSGSKGYFEVTELPYGNYYLIETVAPKGYQGLSEAIPFTISSDSYYQSDVLAIKNTKTPPNTPPIPPRTPNLPNTGEVRAKTIGLAVCLMVFGGYFLLKKRKD